MSLDPGQDDAPQDIDQASKYLIFELGGERYAAILTSIREVIKLCDISPVPYMKGYFKGVINLRGQITSVIDLRAKFGLPNRAASAGLLLIVECASWPLAAIVDDVVTVTAINTGTVEREPLIETKIPLPYLVGIAKVQDRLINVIDIAGTLTHDDFAVIKRKGEAS